MALLGEVPHDSSGGCLRVPLGDLFAGEKRFYYFEVLTPASGQAIEQIFPFELLWTDAEGVPTDVVQNVLCKAQQSYVDLFREEKPPCSRESMPSL